MTIDERVDEICVWRAQNGVREAVKTAMLEAMRDQRHACAQAINALEPKSHNTAGAVCIRQDVAHQAAMNANVE